MKEKPNYFKKIFNLLFYLFVGVMLVGSVIFYTSDKTNKSFFGYRFYQVLTDSMRKTKDNQTGNFVSGDMIIVKVEDPKSIKVGDIITFVPANDESSEKTSDVYLTHRIIKIDESYNKKKQQVERIFTTQGDANNQSDEPISQKNVIGVVVMAIPKMGKIVEYVKENVILVIVMIIALCLLVSLVKRKVSQQKK